MEWTRAATERGTGLWGYHQVELLLRTVSRRWTTRDGLQTRDVVTWELDFALDGMDDPRADRVRTFATQAERSAFLEATFTDLVLRPTAPDEAVGSVEMAGALRGKPVSSVVIGHEYLALHFYEVSNQETLSFRDPPRIIIHDAVTMTTDLNYWPAIVSVIGHRVAWVDLFLDDGLVVAFDDGTEWRVAPGAFTWGPDGENFVAAGPGFWFDAGDEPFPVNAEPAHT